MTDEVEIKKAEWLYSKLINDHLPVPVLMPETKKYYPDQMAFPSYWIGIVRQIRKG
ncbi:MAG: hypothetical protein GY750_04925 [Lentisphaerae bacterium]|nr:hypothetical protein [Lentisphaerota bacterium]